MAGFFVASMNAVLQLHTNLMLQMIEENEKNELELQRMSQDLDILSRKREKKIKR